MWLLPSYGRPEALRRLLDAPGGWPECVMVLVNVDDPQLANYERVMDEIDGNGSTPWTLLAVPAGSRFCEAIRSAYEWSRGEPFYGIIDDDYWPITPGWHEKMVAAAGATGIALANNKVNFPKPYCCRVMGGDLARAIGTIAPGTMRHNFSDDTWWRFATDFGIGVPLEDVIVEHRHHAFDHHVKHDETYERGSADFQQDQMRYSEWVASEERRGQFERVAKLLGMNFTTTDYSKVKLAICVPMQEHSVDFAFHNSFHHTCSMLARKGISTKIKEAIGGSHIGKAREHVLWGALAEMPEATHILYVDADMGWDASLVTRLICADHDFAAIAGVKKQEELSVCYNAFPDPQTCHPVTNFLKVRHVGFAFVLLKRCVIDRMCEAYPNLEYRVAGPQRQWALFFDMMWQHSGHALPDRLSEDFSFCERWQAVGGDIWIDPHARLIHAGRKEYTGAASDLWPKPIAE